MAKRGVITEFFDTEKFNKQLQEVKEGVGDYVAQVDKVKPISIGLKGAEELKPVMDGVKNLSAEQAKYAEILRTVETRIATLNGSSAEFTKVLLDEARAQKELAIAQEKGSKVATEAAKAKLLDAKAALENAKVLAIESRERITNEKAAEREANAIAKSNSIKSSLKSRPIESIPFEINTGDTSTLQNTGEALSDFNRAEAEAANSAVALGNAQKEVAASTNLAASALKAELTPLERSVEERRNLTNSIAFLQKEQKEDAASLKAGQITRAEYNRRMNESGIIIAQQKAKVADLNKEIKVQTLTEKQLAHATKDVVDEYKQLSLAYNEAALKAKNYTLTLGKNNPVTLMAVDNAKRLGNQLKELDASVGQNQRNVGNYTGGIQAAFGKVWSGLRTAANIIPGLGIGGLIGGIVGSLASLVSSVASAAKPFKELKEANDALNETMSNSKYQETIAEVNILKTEIQLAKDGFIDKDDVLKHYNETIGKTTGQVTSLDQAEQALTKNAEAYIRFTLLKAAATEVQGRAAKELVEAEIENQKDLERIAKIGARINRPEDKEGAAISEFIKKGEENLRSAEQKAAQKRVTGLENIATKFLTEAAQISKKFNFNFFEEEENGKGKSSKDSRLKDELELFKFRQKLLIDEQKAIVAAAQGDFRDSARIRQFELEKELIETVAKIELSEKGLTVSKIKLLEEKRDDDLRTLRIRQLNDLESFGRSERDLIAASAKETGDFLTKQEEENQKKIIEAKARQRKLAVDNLAKGFETEQRNIAENLSRTLKAESDRYTKGTITKEQYEKNKLKIENDARRESILGEIKYYETLILLSDLSAEDQKKAIQSLHDLRIKLRALDTADADKKKDKEKKDQEELRKALGDLGKELAGLTFDIFTNAIERQKNAIQDTIDLLDEQKQKDIEVANQTIANAQDRAAAIAVIEARAAGQKAQLERRQRQLDQEKARFERARQVGEIIGNTAVAVSEALPNFVLAAIVAAIGAAQLIRVLAQPIPKYKHGTQDHPGGLAEVGHGKKELAVTPDGKMIETPSTPTVIDLPKHTKVYPDADEALKKITIGLHQRQEMRTRETSKNSDGVHFVKMTNTLGRKIDNLNRTIKNKKEIHYEKPSLSDVVNRTIDGNKEYFKQNGFTKW